jgi:glyoxylase-like metal-dependent hydrolase (beta-lactamase superfamily II)
MREPLMRPEITPLHLATFTFAHDEPHAGESGSVIAYAVRHVDGVLLFDTGFGFGNPYVDDRYQPIARKVDDVLAEAGVSVGEVTQVVNCHLHIDHAGQNGLFPGVPIHVQPAEWKVAHAGNYTILEWINFGGSSYVVRRGGYELQPGIRVMHTAGHTPGHQSLIVDTADGLSILAGQAVYSRGEWLGLPGAREGRSRAWDVDAYDLSVTRLRALGPDRVYFGHDPEIWRR